MSQHGCPERLSNRSKGFQEEGPQPTMEVLVETLTGTAFEMTVSPSDTIFAIKSKICRVEGIPVSQQHLVYNLRELEDGSSLRALGIADGARLRLVLGMRGGPVSTRRLPPPPEPWRDIERLLDSNREESEWGCSSGSGCKVTVVVFREGERVNMLRVRHNPDGSYSPLHTHSESSLSQVSSESVCSACSSCGGGCAAEPEGGALAQNAVTMGKMLDLRRRMETLSIRRHKPQGEPAEMQKTRSEETLSVPSVVEQYEEFGGYSELAPLCEPCRCRCPLQAADRVKVSGGVSGGLLVSRREARRPRSPDLASLASDYGAPVLAPAPAPAPAPRKKPRCGLCRKRLSIATLHRCRCGAEFCAPHRYAEVHGCAYDYKAAPVLPAPAPRLPKI